MKDKITNAFYKAKKINNNFFVCTFFSLLILAPNYLTAAKITPIHNQANLRGKLTILKEGDTVSLEIQSFGLDWRGLNQRLVSVVRDGEFSFGINLDHPVKISLSLPLIKANSTINFNLLKQMDFILAPGNNVTLINNQAGFSFSGPGSVSFKAQYGLALLSRKFWTDNHGQPWDKMDLKKEFDRYDLLMEKSMVHLNRYKQKLLAPIFSIMLSDLYYANEARKYEILNFKRKHVDSIGYVKLNKGFLKPENITGKLYSFSFTNFVLQKYVYDSCFVSKKRFQLGPCFRYIDKTFSGKLKEQLLTQLLLKNIKSDSLTPYRTIALSKFHDTAFRNIVIKYTSARIEGAQAYNFTLPGEDSRQYSLHDFSGKVVVLDFWFTGCGACKTLKPKLEQVEGQFSSDKVVFISISVDKDANVWRNSILQGEYTSANSLKLYTGGVKDEHPLIKYLDVRGYPTLIMIGKDGKLLRNAVNPVIDNGKDMINLIHQEM